jgi:hypothetical protein
MGIGRAKRPGLRPAAAVFYALMIGLLIALYPLFAGGFNGYLSVQGEYFTTFRRFHHSPLNPGFHGDKQGIKTGELGQT